MPRISRGETLGGIYHVINRGNMRMDVFNDTQDFDYFLTLIETGLDKYAIELHAYCLMTNHFHLLLVPQKEKVLSQFMQWLMTSHVRYYYQKNKTSGHIWQGRFKSFIVEQDSYHLTLIRYIEANALRAKMVERAQDWKYGSLSERLFATYSLLHKPYLALEDWVECVNQPQAPAEMVSIRNSVQRQAPLGTKKWVEKTAEKLGLTSTINKQGRPKKNKEKKLN